MRPRDIFQHCPRCGARRAGNDNPFRCPSCDFLYYFNPCCAVGGFILNSAGDLLLLRRARDPARGKLAVPGGFIDIDETAETALRRETLEETGLQLGSLTYVCSQINSYLYQEVTYPVLDLFFVAHAVTPERARPLDGVDAVLWLPPAAVSPDDIAFPSIRQALHQYLQRLPA